uniref:Uncharacterized protein n=1 Tax=Anguilla anguilla TaxID=7936 RepID=A0A0E9TJI2_ANGAN
MHSRVASLSNVVIHSLCEQL